MVCKRYKPNTQNIVEDVIESEPPDKSMHTKGWEQSPIEAEHVIKGLTVGENQIILEPIYGIWNFWSHRIKTK